jgi:hypothetical protein
LKIPGVIYRLGRKPDPWCVPDWASAGPDGTFGNRFDDPEGIYRVLYASSQRLGCFLETLGRFRVDPKLQAELTEIHGEDDYCPLGEVPLEWVEKRVMGVATAGGEYADICSSEWISRLRTVLAGHLERLGLDDLDASVLQMTAPRNLTQSRSGELGFVRAFSNYRKGFGVHTTGRSRFAAGSPTTWVKVQEVGKKT